MRFSKSAHAAEIPFSDPSFSASTIQDATIEARTAAVVTARYTVVTTFNAVVSDRQWLGYNNLLPGNTVPIVVPVNSTLKEITMSFNGTSVSGKLELYRSGTSTENKVYTLTLANVNTSIVATDVNTVFTSGEFLRGRWVDEGANPQDLVIVYVFQADL